MGHQPRATTPRVPAPVRAEHMPMSLRLTLAFVVAACAACKAGNSSVVKWSLRATASPDLRVVGGHIIVSQTDRVGGGIRLRNTGSDTGAIRQRIGAHEWAGRGARLQVSARASEDVAVGAVRLVVETATGIPEALAVASIAGRDPTRADLRVQIPKDAVDVVLEYSIASSQELVVDDVSLERDVVSSDYATLDPALSELLANVAREVRYFSPEVPVDFDWGTWLAIANYELRGVTKQDRVTAYIDTWVKRAAPHAAFDDEPQATELPPANPGARMIGPVVNLGPRTQGTYISYVEGREQPPPVGVYATWTLPQPPCSKIHVSADVVRAAESGINLYVFAQVGGFSTERRSVPLRQGVVEAALEVPPGAQAIKVVVGIDGERELVLRELAAGCSGAMRRMPLDGGELRGGGWTQYERVPGECPSCRTFRLKTPDATSPRAVRLGFGILSYPLAVPAAGSAARPMSIAGAYTSADANLAAAQLLYSELRTFAVKAPLRKEALRSAFRRIAGGEFDLTTIVAARDALGVITKALDDGHSRVVVSAIDAGTLPFEIRRLDGRAIVVAVHPMFKDVLAVGAAVIAIDGVPIAEHLQRVAQRVSAATMGWKDLATNRYALYGPIGSVAMVTLDDGRGSLRTVGIQRVDKENALDEILPSTPEQGAELGVGVRYVRMNQIDATGVSALVPRLVDAKVVIVDLRGFGGPGQLALVAHLLVAPVKSPTWSIARVAPDGATGWEDASWTLYPAQPHVGATVIVLTDARCISSVETVLAVLRAAGSVVVVGEPSAGTNGNEVELQLPGGLMARYTGMRVLVDGRDYNETPTSVDVPVRWTLADVQAGRDPILARAVAIAAELAR